MFFSRKDDYHISQFISVIWVVAYNKAMKKLGSRSYSVHPELLRASRATQCIHTSSVYPELLSASRATQCIQSQSGYPESLHASR